MKHSTPTSSQILLISRDTASRAALTENLRACGYTVHADESRHANELTHPMEVEAIVVELDSLGSDAQILIASMRDIPTYHSTPILAAATNDESAAEAIQYGADDFVLLPASETTLRARLQLLVRYQKASCELRFANECRTEHARMLVSLLDLSAVLSCCDSLEEVLDSIIATATGITQARHAAILLPDANSNELVATAVAGAAPLLEKGQRIPADRGVIASAMRSGTVIELRRGDLSGTVTRPDDGRPVMGVCIPLRSSSQPDAQVALGVMYLSWREREYEHAHATQEMLELVGNLAAVAIEGALARFWRDEARDSLVLALVELAERRDNDTARHLDRVTAFSVLLADELRKEPRFAFVDDAFVEELRRSAPLHDIGKVAIPDSILLKPGKLTVPEMEIMKTHTLVGAEAIRAVRKRLPNSNFGQMAEDIARHHHERFDGTGYPHGLTGDAIPLAARVVSIADVYDALTTQRAYKKALSHDEAMQIITEGAGTHFDPKIVDALRRRGDEIREFARKLSDAFDTETAMTESASEIPMHWYLHAKSGSLIAAPAHGQHAGRVSPHHDLRRTEVNVPAALRLAALDNEHVSTR